MIDDRHRDTIAKLPALLRKAQKARDAAGAQPSRRRNIQIEQRRIEPMRSWRDDTSQLQSDTTSADAIAAQVIAAGARCRKFGGFDLPPALDTRTNTPDDVAAQVIAAAKLRDSGGPPLPELDGVAAEIIEAGRRRRGEA